jgi:integrase
VNSLYLTWPILNDELLRIYYSDLPLPLWADAEFAEYVFANPQQPKAHLRDDRRAWPEALKAAGLEYFWLYDLRHTFASRLTQAGVSPLFVAQIMGHANPNILQTYAKANDEYRRAAISTLEAHREAQSAH